MSFEGTVEGNGCPCCDLEWRGQADPNEPRLTACDRPCPSVRVRRGTVIDLGHKAVGLGPPGPAWQEDSAGRINEFVSLRWKSLYRSSPISVTSAPHTLHSRRRVTLSLSGGLKVGSPIPRSCLLRWVVISNPSGPRPVVSLPAEGRPPAGKSEEGGEGRIDLGVARVEPLPYQGETWVLD
jgi:hypothetical protein